MAKENIRIIEVLNFNKIYDKKTFERRLAQLGLKLSDEGISIFYQFDLYAFKDKNGKKIFENDFVKDEKGNLYYIPNFVYKTAGMIDQNDPEIPQEMKDEDMIRLDYKKRMDEIFEKDKIKVLIGYINKEQRKQIEFAFSYWEKYAPKARLSIYKDIDEI